MNYEWFLAKRMIFSTKSRFSGPLVRLAVTSITVGTIVMILAIAIIKGFQLVISDKVTGFAAHIQVARFDSNNSFEYMPISSDQSFLKLLAKNKDIKHVQVFATKTGIIKTDDQNQGIVMKGVGGDFDWSFFKNKLVEGKIIHYIGNQTNDSVLISKILASQLKLKVGDAIRTFFVSNNQVRVRKLIVSGIYDTGLEDLDKLFIFGDINQIRKINNWSPDQVSGFEIMLKNIKDLPSISLLVYHTIPSTLNSMTIRELYPQIFDWLDLLNLNTLIILVLMVLVSGITMISALLILVLERTNLIGILKSMGATSLSIRKIFIYNAAYIIFKGLLLGNVIGIGLSLLQIRFGFFRLPAKSYFMPVVPIDLNVANILLLNIGVLVISILMLIFPSFIIAKISPAKSIKFT